MGTTFTGLFSLKAIRDKERRNKASSAFKESAENRLVIIYSANCNAAQNLFINPENNLFDFFKTLKEHRSVGKHEIFGNLL